MEPRATIEHATDELKRGATELDALLKEGVQLAHQARSVADAEMRLAVAEVQEGVQATVRVGITGAIAAVIGVLMLFWASASAFFGLAEVMPVWAASLVTFGIVLVLTLIFAMVAKGQAKHISLMPRKAIRAVKEDREWLLDQISSKASSTGVAKPSGQA